MEQTETVVASNGKLTQKVTIEQITIPAPNFQRLAFTVQGTAPLVMHKFSQKVQNEMKEKQEAGPTAAKGKKRKPKDFEEQYENAKHLSTDGWPGIPATAFRNAMISACKIVGFHMTKGKISVFVEQDGFSEDGVPLIEFTKGEPHYHETAVRLATGVADIRARPMWDPGWEAAVRVRFDADIFTASDVTNLLMRAGLQVGILEGRPDSKKSTGQGWGTFDIVGSPEAV